jgi:hypothetical protein
MASAVRTRVVKGEGVFQAHKVKYNWETHQLLRGNIERGNVETCHN